MKNHVMICPPPQNQNEVATPSGSWRCPPPQFFEDFGGHFHVMCAQLRPVATTTSLGSVRRLPTRSAAPRLARSTAAVASIDWAHAELNAMIIYCATTCERGAVKASDDGWCTSHLLALLRVASLVKMVKERHLQFSDQFCLIFSWKGRYPRPYSFFFIKKTKRSSFQRYNSFTLNNSWTARSKEPAIEKGTFPLLKKLLFHFGE